MFNFFKGFIGELELKLIDDFSNKVRDFINDLFEKIKKDKDDGVKEIEASSGNYSQQASSGDNSKQASSGDYSKHEVTGNNSIAFACGRNSIIKAKKGTWIALAEYTTDGQGYYIPDFAISAQIGNKDYKDAKGRVLKENEFYILHNKKIYPVDVSDGISTIKISEKVRDGITIIKGLAFCDDEVYLVKQDDLAAHGKTLREALEDLQFKKIKSKEIEDIVKEIKESGKVTRAQYRAITGACSFGTEQFCKQHGIENLEEIELEELRKILVNDYGAEKFWKLIDEK